MTRRKFKPGVYPDVDEADYHSGAFGPREGSLSHSGIKNLLKAPALFQHEQAHPTTKRSWDLGTAAHKLVLGVGESLEIVMKTAKDGSVSEAGDYLTPSARAHRDEIRASGARPVLRHELDQVTAMAKALHEHPDASKLLRNGAAEVSAYAIDEATGIWRRCRFDYLRPELGIDYKSATTASPQAFAKASYDHGYYIQAPFYLDLARDLGHDLGDFAFIAQEKTPPYLVGVYLLDEEAMDLGRRAARRALDLYRECVGLDFWPGYSARDNTLSLPGYAYAREDTA